MQLRQRVDELCWPHHTYSHITWMVQQGRHALVRVAPAVSLNLLLCCTSCGSATDTEEVGHQLPCIHHHAGAHVPSSHGVQPDLFTTSCRMCCSIWPTLKLSYRGSETVIHPHKLLHRVPEQERSLPRCSEIWQQPRWAASRPWTPVLDVVN